MATVITTLSGLQTACSSGGTYELGADISGVSVTVAADTTLNLDLKDYSLIGDDTNTVVTIAGTLNLYGNHGAIKGGRATNGAGVIVADDAEFNLYGGNIRENNAESLGGGVHISGGIFTQYGGSVSDNNANRGGGVYIPSGGTYTLRGGYVKGNSASRGGGVYMTTGGLFNLYGGFILRNRATTGGGFNLINGACRIYGGSPIIIRDNTNSGGTVINNVTIADTRVMQILGNITLNSEIRITSPVAEGTVIATNTGGYTGYDRILLDDGTMYADMSGTNVVLTPVSVITTLSQLKTACSTGGHYRLGADISGVNVTVSKKLSLDLQTYKLIGSSGKNVITANAELMIYGTTGTIQGGSAGIFHDTNYGDMDVYIFGGIITGNGDGILFLEWHP